MPQKGYYNIHIILEEIQLDGSYKKGGNGSNQKNVFGLPLKSCSLNPVTGFFRTGCCETNDLDHGVHTVCVKLTEEFLEFSVSVGNDLSTPRPEYQFPGLKPGDFWCLCASRWLEAFQNGKAPLVKLSATNSETLKLCELDDLIKFAIDKPVNDN